MADPEDRFLARWSRRKRGPRRDSDAAAAPAEDPPPADVAEPGAAEPGAAEPGAAEPGTVAEELPDIDSLDDSSDFSVFLKQGVPDAIRRKALRKLWRINPVLANLDGLNDYDEDFSKLGMVAGTLKTAYKVGKGYLDENEVAEEEGAEGDAGLAADTGAGDEPTQIAERSQAALEPETALEPESALGPESALEPESALGPESGPDLKTVGGAETLAAAKEEIQKPARGSARKRRWGDFTS